jgi:SAM-dependent methyltransferase
MVNSRGDQPTAAKPRYIPSSSDVDDWKRAKNRVSHWNRRRKWRLFERVVEPRPTTTVLDVGYSDEEYSMTDNFIEKHYPYPEMLTALGIDEPNRFRERYPKVKAVQYEGKVFPFEDQAFDVVWSNAVIEHVGDREAQLQFLREVRRVGRRAFITTPNKLFPVEVHTRTPLLHFLPLPIFESYLRLVGKSWATGDYMRLLSIREVEKLLGEAGITSYRLHRNRLAGFVLDVVILIEE